MCSRSAPDYKIRLDTVIEGFESGDSHCWVHPRAGAIPGDPPLVVMTLQPLLLSGSDIFGPLYELRTGDLGKSWRGPVGHPDSLGRRDVEPGAIIPDWNPLRATRQLYHDPPQMGVCDFTPAWHRARGTLLGTGSSVCYVGERLARGYPRDPAYSTYDPRSRSWSPWRTIGLPDGDPFHSCVAGSSQRCDLDDGTILLPVRCVKRGGRFGAATVLRLAFEGRELEYIGHGSMLELDRDRGYAEPSLTCFRGRYYLTLRADDRGAVTSGTDGLHFDTPRIWSWDDGTPVPTYNTQQHWVTHSGGLFLVYTRVAEGNDHVFRHRAPLFMARVDPGRLCLIRATERILVPERGARLGNFQVVDVTPRETWVTVAEWMQPADCERYGSRNAVYVARILWGKENERATGTNGG